MTIRAANEADIPAIIEIERTPGFEQFFGWFSEDEHRAHLTDPDCRVLVLDEGGIVEGFALLRGFVGGEGSIRLNRLAARTPGKGAGQQLLDHAKAIAFAEPATQRFWLRVAETNSRARHVYERNGFVLEGRLPAGGKSISGQPVDIALYGLLREVWQFEFA
ncbi:GNAT family N-acetyltransferase [Rhizobium sp. C1]|uniref:GNAT family N-acetyltransferase n=1 Tax=Rhizobium sp. C1 TaxID=1349799 RepID=UPI001E4B4C30|nr:N-acetyltransferase [Rhizobium sp. C1]MCD2179058.1 GNAT family N-acetyltransferase [Rhizobium sp. C1]